MVWLKKIIVSITLLFVCLFVNVGYASLVNELNISGTAQAIPPAKYDVYLTASELISTNSTSNIMYQHEKPTNFLSIVGVSKNDSSITYKLTVINETNVTYYYNGYQFVDDVSNNSLIGETYGISIVTKDKLEDSTNTFNNEDWIPPTTSRDFYITYVFKRDAVNLGEVGTKISFKFTVHIDAAHEEFMRLLNDDEIYQILVEAFDDKYKESQSTVLGNVGDDKEIFDKIFGRDLTIEIDGEEKPLTILIERKNVDGKSTGDSYTNHGGNNDLKGCEYTMYLTVDDVSSSGGTANVYAITYTQDNSGNWHKIAQLYEGTCPKVDYDSSTEGYQGAYDVSKWTAVAKEYQVTDDIVYKVGQSSGDQYDIMKDIASLMSTTDNDIFNELDNTKYFKKVYDILDAHKYSTAADIVQLRAVFEAAAPYYVIYNNGQEIKVKRNCTRAEILGYIEDINIALEYYYQVNGN